MYIINVLDLNKPSKAPTFFMSKDLAIIFLAAHVRDKDCTSYQQTPLCSEVQYSIIMWEGKY